MLVKGYRMQMHQANGSSCIESTFRETKCGGDCQVHLSTTSHIVITDQSVVQGCCILQCFLSLCRPCSVYRLTGNNIEKGTSLLAAQYLHLTVYPVFTVQVQMKSSISAPLRTPGCMLCREGCYHSLSLLIFDDDLNSECKCKQLPTFLNS